MSGYYHSVTVDTVSFMLKNLTTKELSFLWYVVQENHYFVTEYSSESTSPSVAVYSIRFEPLSSELLQSIWAGPGVLIML